MRFLANENVEQPVVDALRVAGHDVSCVGEIGAGASDEEVLRLANAQQRLVLTNDKDFGELVYREGRAAEGVVLLRLAVQDGLEKARRVTEIIRALQGRLSGHFAIVTEEHVRLRPLRRP